MTTVDAIYRELKRLGYEGWCKWKSSNSLAAFQECLTGYELQRTFESHFLFPCGSYRPMAGQASSFLLSGNDFSRQSPQYLSLLQESLKKQSQPKEALPEMSSV